MRALTLALALSLTGCASQVVVGEPFEAAGARDDARAKHEELMELERTVAAAIDRGACDETICPTAERICSLSDAICRLAARHEGDRELSSRCSDASRRCGDARARVADACGCRDGGGG